MGPTSGLLISQLSDLAEIITTKGLSFLLNIPIVRTRPLENHLRYLLPFLLSIGSDTAFIWVIAVL